MTYHWCPLSNFPGWRWYSPMYWSMSRNKSSNSIVNLIYQAPFQILFPNQLWIWWNLSLWWWSSKRHWGPTWEDRNSDAAIGSLVPFFNLNRSIKHSNCQLDSAEFPSEQELRILWMIHYCLLVNSKLPYSVKKHPHSPVISWKLQYDWYSPLINSSPKWIISPVRVGHTAVIQLHYWMHSSQSDIQPSIIGNWPFHHQ